MEVLNRTLIIGNSGSGKSTLALKLADLTDTPAIDLDIFHWEAGAYGVKRDEDTSRRMVQTAAAEPRWIIEGVFGWLAEVAVPRATALIWLDMPWDLCRAGLLARGPRRGGTDADHQALLSWAEAYWTRKTPSSFTGHQTIFESFLATKYHLHDRTEVNRLLHKLAVRNRNATGSP